MKPSIGRKVYCIYHNEHILKETVYAVGEKTFFISSFGGKRCADSWEWWYDDYGETWFTNLEKAKRKLSQNVKEEYPNEKFDFYETQDYVETYIRIR
jgi:hypothetical protein